MKLNLSVLDRPSGKLHAEVDVPVLDGTDFDTGSFALPPVQDVSGGIARPDGTPIAGAGTHLGARALRRGLPVQAALARMRSSVQHGSKHADAGAPTAAAQHFTPPD
jgi:hypothetical protein